MSQRGFNKAISTDFSFVPFFFLYGLEFRFHFPNPATLLCCGLGVSLIFKYQEFKIPRDKKGSERRFAPPHERAFAIRGQRRGCERPDRVTESPTQKVVEDVVVE